MLGVKVLTTNPGSPGSITGTHTVEEAAGLLKDIHTLSLRYVKICHYFFR